MNTHGNTDVDPPKDISDDQPRIESNGFLQSSSAETTSMDQHDSSKFQNTITSSGQIFNNASEFRDALYLMSLAGKFRYSFKRNSPKQMTVVCRVDECPWKITCRAWGSTNTVQVHTFRNVHNHSLEDVASYKPILRSQRASLVIDNVIRSNPDYHPRQICEDFIKQHGMRLSYSQAWHLKEKAKERIYGRPKNYYKLLPWMCERIVQKNPGTIIELNHSSDGHFEQLFIAHAVSIHGFTLGCRPIIAIDSSHMSGAYKDAIFSATSYDANDSVFPLAIGVMSSENYEDWSWFLKNLKKVIGDKKVVIISDRRPALLCSVPEIFGVENHAHCYHHVKEEFSSFLNKNIIKGNKGKENALQWLDSIAYARLEHDYNVRMCELRKFNDALATWVEDNSPKCWAMSKFPKNRWDKMTTNFDESFTVWLRDERHYSICHFMMEHMDKLAAMLVKNKEESTTWEGSIGPKIKEKVMLNISKGEGYPVAPSMNGVFGVCIGKSVLNVDTMNQTCTCKAWQMLGIPCEHACAALLSTGQNVYDFVEDCYKFPKQELVYSGSFRPIETHDMPSVNNDGVVRDLTGQIFSSLNPPHGTKRPMGRPRKKHIESQVMDRKTLFCSQCHMAGHNRKTCKRSLS